jgi:hypothetical protein
VPTPRSVIVLPLLPEVVQTEVEPEVKTTVRDEEDVAETVNVSAE